MHRQDLDALKGIAIIAVVLFHIGLLRSGYLGVDAFFVINGFLVTTSVINKIISKEFSFLGFLEKRLTRLLPLIVLASILSLGMGLFLMLPDDLENLSQEIIAGNLFSENILSAITTNNYWDISNDYKPLMHLWYVGILFEFYLIMPLLMMVANKLANKFKTNEKTWMVSILGGVTIVSLIYYLLPNVSTGDRFYYIQYRFFELGFGGVIGLVTSELKRGGVASKIISFLLIGIIFSSVYNILVGNIVHIRYVIGGSNFTTTGMPLSGTVSLLLTVLLTVTFVAFKDNGIIVFRSKVLAWIGKMSYSIFIWHQVFLAFYRYSVSNEITLKFTVVFIMFTLVVASLSYYLIEKKIKVRRKTLIGWSVAAILIMTPSGWLYLHAGVIRDIPELNITKNNVRVGMFAEYCDRIYQYKEFPGGDNGKVNILVEGISFGRDFGNILLESQYKDSINLVYVFKWEEADNIPEIVSKADYIFTFRSKRNVPESVWENLCEGAIIKGIGTKNFGESNGIIYKNRNNPDYLNQSIEMVNGYSQLNEMWKLEWGKDYIDMIAPVLIEKNRVRVFTDDGKFISPDTGHLSQAGAQWYAKMLDWNKIFEKE